MKVNKIGNLFKGDKVVWMIKDKFITMIEQRAV